jgi:5-methylcytosine-specific restriction endonuclease McrA
MSDTREDRIHTYLMHRFRGEPGRCRNCGREVTAARRRSWCSATCYAVYRNLLNVTRTRQYLFARSPWCADCGTRLTLGARLQDGEPCEVNHVVPLVLGGAHDWHNFQLLCVKCHAKRTSELRLYLTTLK